MRDLTDIQLDQAMSVAIRGGDEAAFHRIGAEMDRRDADRHARLSGPDALARAALWYAGCGVAVFPIRPRDKRPLPGSHGFKDATCDVDVVRRWWAGTPAANIGAPTGGLFDVVDVDGPAGYQSLADLREAGGLPAVTARAGTPRGGMHLYIVVTGDGNSAAVLPGIDYRGAGGYVVVPPSVGGNGQRYDWLDRGLDVAALRSG